MGDRLDAGDDLDELEDYHGVSAGIAKWEPAPDLTKVLAKLDEETVRLGKAQKIAEKATGQALHATRHTSKTRSCLEELMQAQETAELLCGQASFVVKFKKDSSGNLVTADFTVELCGQVTALTTELVQGVKCLRALCPDIKMLTK